MVFKDVVFLKIRKIAPRQPGMYADGFRKTKIMQPKTCKEKTMENTQEQQRAKFFQPLSDKIGDNQFAKIEAVCIGCGKLCTVEVERTSPTEIVINKGAIGIRRSNGEMHFKCDACADDPDWGMPIDVYSRVVGFLRPVQYWNPGKQEEYHMRKVFDPEKLGTGPDPDLGTAPEIPLQETQ